MNLKKRLIGSMFLAAALSLNCDSTKPYGPEVPFPLTEIGLRGRLVWDIDNDGIPEPSPSTSLVFYRSSDSIFIRDTTDFQGFFEIKKGFLGEGILYAMNIAATEPGMISVYYLERNILMPESKIGDVELKNVLNIGFFP